jgi:uncharacterized membrane protein YkgB
MKYLEAFATRYGLLLLRLSLGITFLWFGLLKLIGMSPVTPMIFAAIPPFMAEIPGFYFMVAALEIVIGLGFLLRRTIPVAVILLLLHLLVATLSVLLTQGFSPTFPFLTLEGEFVMKNPVLIAAALVVFAQRKQKGV